MPVSVTTPRGLSRLAPPLRALVLHVLRGEGRRAGEVGVVLAGDALLRETNRAWRGMDHATDVISFAYDEHERDAATRAVTGDLLVSLDRVAAQARQLIGFPVTNFRVVINDGASHSVDSSDNAFQAAAREAFRSVYFDARPTILEPIMKVAIEGPTEFQGAFVRTVMQRRGIIVGTLESEGFVRVDADVPLAEMFGYSTDLRSSSQGKAEYTMEFAHYAPVPGEVREELIKKYGTGTQDEDE